MRQKRKTHTQQTHIKGKFLIKEFDESNIFEMRPVIISAIVEQSHERRVKRMGKWERNLLQITTLHATWNWENKINDAENYL